MKAYRTHKNKDLPFLSTYCIQTDDPKWALDIKQHKDEASIRNGIAQRTPTSERPARIVEKFPTVMGTNKPQGVKRARAMMIEIAAKDRAHYCVSLTS